MPEVVVRDRSGHPILQVEDDGYSVKVLGQTVPMSYFGRVSAAIAAIANLLTVNVPAASDRSYEISGNVNVTTATAHAFTMTCSYTDETGTARVLTMTFGLVAGGVAITSIANGNGAVPYMGAGVRIRCKAGTQIVFATAGTFTTVVYNAEAAAVFAG